MLAVTMNGLVGMLFLPRTGSGGRWGGPGLGVLGGWDPITDGDLVKNDGDRSSILTYKWGLLITYWLG